MLEPPKQNWSLYEERCREANAVWLRSLTPERSVKLLEELYKFGRLLLAGRADLERYEETIWGRKLALRTKLCQAFQALDRLGDGRCDSKNST